MMKTKNFTIIIIWILIFIITGGIISCSDKLEQYPTDQFAIDEFWNSETNAMIALVGVYRGNVNYSLNPHPTDWWTPSGTVYFELATDNGYDRRGDNSDFNRLTNGQLLANNDYIRRFWVNSYKRIAICNNFIENIENVDMEASKIERMISEARFIRACQYFYMSQYWGSVPLVTRTLTPNEANTVTKSSKSEIVAFVISELIDAAGKLPRYKDMGSDEKGRACKQAALAFLGRMYLSEDRFQEASDTYKEIIDYGDNIIDPDYITLFNPINESSSENIFSFQFLEDIFGNDLPQRTYPRSLGGYNLVNIYSSLSDEYDWDDGTPFSYNSERFNWEDMAANRDPRFRYTIIWHNSEFSGKTISFDPDDMASLDRTTYSLQATRSGYGLRKFFDETFTGNLHSGYGGDMPIIRYAEVLLSYLEAKLESGHTITQELLDETINKVRGRESVKMPPIVETNPNDLRPILRKERRIELAFEGIRYWDLLRWGIAGEVLKGDFWGAPFPNSTVYNTTSKKIDPTGNKRWYVTSKAFRVGQDEIWPIPESEININPALAN